MLVGLIGKAGVGKSEAAKLLSQEFGLKRAAFADLLKHALIHWGVPQTNLVGSQSDKDIPLADWNGLSGRQYMQKLGTAMRDLDPDFWVKAFYQWHDDDKHLVIEDVRMPNEAQSIRARGGLLIKIDRPGVTGTKHSGHVSETSVDRLMGDVLIVNNGSLDDYRRHILTAAKRFRDGKIAIDRMRHVAHK